MYKKLRETTQLYLIIIIFLSVILNSHDVSFASIHSPSFSEQEIGDAKNDEIVVNTNTKTYRIGGTTPFDKSVDITSVNYFSDGNILNSTLWLNGDVYGNVSEVVSEPQIVIYGMLIDADSNPKTGTDGVDYQLELQWNSDITNWAKIFGKYSSGGYIRTINQGVNGSYIYEGDPYQDTPKHYVILSLDLKSIALPNKYRVMYYSEIIYDINNPSKVVIDYTNWVDIPPRQFELITLPNQLIISPGEKKTVEVRIASNGTDLSKINKLDISGNLSDIDVQLPIAGETQSSSPGFGSVPLSIRASPNVRLGEYLIPVLANISTGAAFPSEFLGKGIIPIPPSFNTHIVPGALMLTVQSPPFRSIEIPQEYLIGLYTVAATIFTGWFVPNIARWINSKRQMKHVSKFLSSIGDRYQLLDNSRNSSENGFEDLILEIANSFATGKISESGYKILNEGIIYYQKKLATKYTDK